MILTKIQVKTNNQKYPIIIGNKIIHKTFQILKNNSINFDKCLLVVDNKVPLKLIRKIIGSLSKKK